MLRRRGEGGLGLGFLGPFYFIFILISLDLSSLPTVFTYRCQGTSDDRTGYKTRYVRNTSYPHRLRRVPRFLGDCRRPGTENKRLVLARRGQHWGENEKNELLKLVKTSGLITVLRKKGTKKEPLKHNDTINLFTEHVDPSIRTTLRCYEQTIPMIVHEPPGHAARLGLRNWTSLLAERCKRYG